MDAVARDFSEYGDTEWYLWVPNPADNPDITVLQWFTGKSVDASWPALLPATWCREYGRGAGKGRVFYTILSHEDEVYASENYRRLILNALQWAAKDGESDVIPYRLDINAAPARASRAGHKRYTLNGRMLGDAAGLWIAALSLSGCSLFAPGEKNYVLKRR
jgi:type 1 glutamine amidotransferase